MKRATNYFFILIFFTICTSATASNSQHGLSQESETRLAMCCIFRDEAEYLQEWIEFHKIVGVEHFYLYNNLSQDNYLEILQPYIERGEVDLFEWDRESSDETTWSLVQVAAYNHCLKMAKGSTTWLAFLDTDEFLFSRSGDKIQDSLQFVIDDPNLNRKCGGILIPWILFGTSNVEKIPRNRTLIETLTMCQGRKDKKGKTICRPEYVWKIQSAHHALYTPGSLGIRDNSGLLMHDLQLNHYWARDEDFLWNVKVARQNKWGVNYGDMKERSRSLNSIMDTEILYYVPILRKNLGLQN